jgi:catechol 2,3-dioxygenase-like lactoylglutathione lyase family enzyme
MQLEVVVVPVSDVDRAKNFYEMLGWRLDADYIGDDDFRVVQLTPPGSECSIIIGTGITSAVPGSAESLLLVVHDIEAARAELVGRGVEASALFHFSEAGQVDGPDPQRADYGTFLSFDDLDGNGWLVQEVGRATPRAS